MTASPRNMVGDDGFPLPEDDVAAKHLAGASMPDVVLPSTAGEDIVLSRLPGRTVVFAYTKTGVPGQPNPDGWDIIPGAHGSTPQACGFRDLYAELRGAGASAVFGLSTQKTAYQREVRDRLQLPYQLLSDADLKLAYALRLPLFNAGEETLLKRLTLIINNGVIRHVFYPVFTPAAHAGEVLTWLQTHT